MENMRKYAGLFIVVPEKADSFDEVKGKINTVVREHSGKILDENLMGKRKLAYLIKKKSEAVYYELKFEADPDTIAHMMREFNINTDILRTLIDKDDA